MNWLRSKWPTREDRQATNTTSKSSQDSLLLDLPGDVFHMILGLLELSDISCLALCSRSLHREFAFALKDLVSKPEQRSRALRRIVRDESKYLYCNTCARLHLRWRFGPPGPRFQSRGLQQCLIDQPRDAEVIAWGFRSRYRLRSQHISLAMDEYLANALQQPRSAKTCRTPYLNSLFYSEIRFIRSPNNRAPLTACLSVQPLILTRHIQRAGKQTTNLYLRTQQSLVFPNEAELTTPSPVVLIFTPCPHITPPSTQMLHFMFQQWTGRVSHDYVHPSDLLRCPTCATEFTYDFTLGGQGYVTWQPVRSLRQKNADERIAIVLTCWRDMGTGADAADAEWARLGCNANRAGHIERFDRGETLRGPAADNGTRGLFEKAVTGQGKTDGGQYAMNMNLVGFEELIMKTRHCVMHGGYHDSFCRLRATSDPRISEYNGEHDEGVETWVQQENTFDTKQSAWWKPW